MDCIDRYVKRKKKTNRELRFWVDLRHTIIPIKGNATFSFTRATTATITDNVGRVWNCKSGEARFLGARRVENLIAASENLGHGNYSATQGSFSLNATTAPNGTTTADKFIEDNTLNNHGWSYSSIPVIVGRTYTFSIYAKAAGRNWMNIGLNSSQFSGGASVYFNLATGVIGQVSGTGTGAIEDAGNGWYRCSVTATCTSSGSNVVFFRSRDMDGGGTYQGDGTSGTFNWGMQVSEVDYVPEYVSTGVLSAPYHGAGVDGVKYFTTTKTGAPISESTIKGFLSERQRTNLITDSEALGAASWTPSRATVSANVIASPSKGQTADKLVEDNTSGAHYVSDTISLTANDIVTVSVYAKAGEVTAFQLGTGSNALPTAHFDLTNVIAEALTADTASIETMENGWYRCSCTGTVASTTTYECRLQLERPYGTATYTGDNSSGMYFWGAQVEIGQDMTSYIPTSGSAATRNQDVLSTTNIGWYDQTGGTFYVEYYPRPAFDGTVATGTIFSFTGGTTGITLSNTDGTNADSYPNLVVDGIADIDGDTYSAGLNKVAFRFQSDDFELVRNGTSVGTDTSGTFTDGKTTLAIGANGLNMNHSVRCLKYYIHKLSLPILQSKTT